MSLDLGRRAELLRVRLIRGDALATELETDADVVEPVTLVFDAPAGANASAFTWTAVLVAPNVAQFSIPAETVLRVINEAPSRRVRLMYGGHVWGLGEFEVEG